MRIALIIYILIIMFNTFWDYQSAKNYKLPNDDRPKQTLFDQDFDLEETDLANSENNLWWLNSGATFVVKGGIGSTVQGDLAENSKWARLYSKNNPIDTESGKKPQNIFRLIYKVKQIDTDQRVCFKVNRTNTTDSPNRNQSNGFLLFSHYIDDDNLYYAGIRVDGQLVIKKKLRGEYNTLALKSVFDGQGQLSLPEYNWIGIRSTAQNTNEGTLLRVYIDNQCADNWENYLETVDQVNNLSEAGYQGIRSDFMDLDVKNYKIN